MWAKKCKLSALWRPARGWSSDLVPLVLQILIWKMKRRSSRVAELPRGSETGMVPAGLLPNGLSYMRGVVAHALLARNASRKSKLLAWRAFGFILEHERRGTK